MTIQLTLRSVLLTAISLVAVVVVGYIFLLGAVTFPYPYEKLGNYFITTNSKGIGIYQPGKYSNYLLSPSLDYALDGSYKPTPLADVHNTQGTGIGFDMLINRWETVLHYFGMGAFRYQSNGVEYRASIEGNTLTIGRSVQRNAVPGGTQTLRTVFEYNRDDFLIDETGILYTENADADKQMLEKITGIMLVRDAPSNRKSSVGGRVLHIVNPQVPGILVIALPTGDTFVIDKDAKQIQIHTPLRAAIGGTHVSDFTISTSLASHITKKI